MSANASRPTPIRVVAAARRAEDRRAVVDSLRAVGGFSCSEAGSLDEALRLCSAGGVACVLLHLDLPDAGILEALHALAREPGASAIPVVVLSSHLGDDYCLDLVAAGADDAIGVDGLQSGGLRRTIEHAIARRARGPVVPAASDAALRASETRARLALRAADLGAWEHDLRSGRISWSERCATIFGARREEFAGDYAAFESFVLPEDREAVRAIGVEALRAGPSGGGTSVEFRIRRPDGDERWLVSHGGVVAGADGAAARVVGIVQDITSRKRAEVERERLLAAERAARVDADRAGRLKDEFLATISHELRTPLNSILGWTRLLSRRGARPEMVDEGLRVIERNARIQAQLISDLLDVNRIVSGKLLLEVANVDLNDASAAALETLHPAAEERRVVVELRAAPDLPSIHGDVARLQQVIWNLLSNAIKFTPEGGRVTLETRRSGDDVELEVRDTGQGIEPDFVAHVFDRFRQADGSAARRHGGLGLGLAIVKHLVEMHGGTVTASSGGPRRGSSFTVRLPALGTQARPVPEIAADALRGVAVLLVDDQLDALEFTRRLFVEHGAEVQTAARAEEALDLLRAAPSGALPTVLVSDIGMPGMDGYELLRAVRDDLGLGPEQLPAIAVTAFAREDDRRDSRAVGYQAHLTKPFAPDRLIAAVGALVPPKIPDGPAA